SLSHPHPSHQPTTTKGSTKQKTQIKPHQERKRKEKGKKEKKKKNGPINHKFPLPPPLRTPIRQSIHNPAHALPSAQSHRHPHRRGHNNKKRLTQKPSHPHHPPLQKTLPTFARQLEPPLRPGNHRFRRQAPIQGRGGGGRDGRGDTRADRRARSGDPHAEGAEGVDCRDDQGAEEGDQDPGAREGQW
ncbi:hypothetical protein L873DRAFT_1844856, partial [Choiromyces venosus 120613-1]